LIAVLAVLSYLQIVEAVELNQTLIEAQKEAGKQAQRSHTKFIDDWDEEK
jgi:hypothetical protein